MTFEKQKKDLLTKTDKSNKKNVDNKIKKGVNYINSLRNYYTTSSCSGRILLIERAQGEKKSAKIIFTSHNNVSFNQIKNSLKTISKKPLWFKQESTIIHVCCKTIEDANKLIQIARDSGLKRAGIISFSRKTIVEIIGTENIETIVADKAKLLINDNYLKKLVMEGNKKLKINLKNLNKFYNNLKSHL